METYEEYDSILDRLDSIPAGPERNKALRLELAKAWHQGYETAYNDGGVDSNPYMTLGEIRKRNEQIKADHDAYVMARVTGSVGATAHRSYTEDGETVEVTGTYSRCGEWDPARNTICGREVMGGECPLHGEVGP
jgi:hypothetical protein